MSNAQEREPFELQRNMWWGKGQRPEAKEENDDVITPFSIDVPDSELEYLKKRLKDTRLPRFFQANGWDHGVSLEYMQELLPYWTDTYDWRTHEAHINEEMPQFTTMIDGINLHFVHARSTADNAIPLVISHGWPGSILEFRKILPLLTSGAGGSQAFHVVAPSIPGYGFSSQAERTGMNNVQTAVIYAKLMARLGYDKYFAQGGDWGSMISTNLALVDPEHVLGIHLNYLSMRNPPWTDLSEDDLTEDEKRKFHGRSFSWHKKGYSHMHATKPHTIGLALADSPVGLAAWIIEKFHGWTDCHDDVESRLSKDQLLTNVMIYWITNTITSSMRYYRENYSQAGGHAEVLKAYGSKVETPCGVACFPAELRYTPRTWAEKMFTNIKTWTEFDKGGHFAATEEPELLAEDFRKFVSVVMNDANYN